MIIDVRNQRYKKKNYKYVIDVKKKKITRPSNLHNRLLKCFYGRFYSLFFVVLDFTPSGIKYDQYSGKIVHTA